MGHGTHSQDIAHHNRAAGGLRAAGRPRPSRNPRAGPGEVNKETPIVRALDVNRSFGQDTRLLDLRLPRRLDRLLARGVVQGPGIRFAAGGDAEADQGPLQVGPFGADNRLDAVPAAMWIEEGGLGTDQESYELCPACHAGTRGVRLERGEGGRAFIFFVGDEGVYPVLRGGRRARILGQEAVDLPAEQALAALQEKFPVFPIYPASSMEERGADIDAGIRRRAQQAGSQHANVDVFVSLAWDQRNDLDLHVTAPSGELISFGHRQSRGRGMLDVDRNVQGETTTPVENVPRAWGAAPEGGYEVRVRNDRLHDPVAPTPFRVEIECGGERFPHEGVISPGGQTGPDSDVVVRRFRFTVDAEARARLYGARSDEVVLRPWSRLLPEGHILRLRDRWPVTEALPGALAIANGRGELPGILEMLCADGPGAAAPGGLRTALAGVRRVAS